MPTREEIEWREEMRMDRAEFDSRMAVAREQWMQQVQTRNIRDTDQQIKVGSHGMTMAERAQRMGIERVNLALKIAETRVSLADRWIKVGITGEQLINMRIARREWARHVRGIKRDLKIAHRKAKDMARWSSAMDELVWGEVTNPTLISRAWAGMFSIRDKLPRARKLLLARMKVTEEQKDPSHYFTKTKNLKPSKSKSATGLLNWCKKNKCVPIELTPAQEFLFTYIESIETGYAELGAQHQAYVAKRREEIALMRQTHWKKHSVN